MNEGGLLRKSLALAQVFWVGALVAYVAHFAWNRWGEFQTQEWEIAGGWMGLAILLALLRRLAGAVRWALLALWGKGVLNRTAWVEHMGVYFISNLASYLPGSFWYIPSRIKMGRGRGLTALHTTLAAVYETGLLVATGLAASSYSLARTFGFSAQASLAALVISALGSLAFFHPAAVSASARLLLRALRRERIVSTVPFGWAAALWASSAAVWLFSGGSLFALLRGLDGSVPASSVWYLTSASAAAWTAGFLAPWAPSGLGVREGFLGWLLTGTVSAPILVVAVTAARLLTVVEDLFWAAVAVLAQRGGRPWQS